MSKRSSPKQLLIGYLCITVVVFLLAGLCGLYMVRNLYVQQTAEDLEARARLCAKQIVELLERNETDAVDALCKELGEAVDTRITVIRPTGEVVGDTYQDPQKMENHSNRPEIKQVIENPTAVGRSTRYSTTLEETLMYVAVASPQGSSPVAIVRTSIPIAALTNKLRSANQGVFTAGLVAVFLVIALIPWFSIRLTPVVDDTKRGLRRPKKEEHEMLETTEV